MTKDQARALVRDVNVLPEALGVCKAFDEYTGAPCCAVGHLASMNGYTPPPGVSGTGGAREVVGTTYSVNPLVLEYANDSLDADDRRRASVIEAAEEMVRENGYDPAQLREEVSA